MHARAVAQTRKLITLVGDRRIDAQGPTLAMHPIALRPACCQSTLDNHSPIFDELERGTFR